MCLRKDFCALKVFFFYVLDKNFFCRNAYNGSLWANGFCLLEFSFMGNVSVTYLFCYVGDICIMDNGKKAYEKKRYLGYK